MNDHSTIENIIRLRMHGLYLSRRCDDLETLAHEMLGMHSWFCRNVPFSALIRGADIRGWKTRLTKTWLYRGTLHGVAYEDLPELLALSAGEQKDGYFSWLSKVYGEETIRSIANEVLLLMEDGVYSRTEFRRIFIERYEPKVIEDVFSSWGGVFVYLARLGKVAFKNMTSRDFDLISAEPVLSFDEVLPELLGRYFRAYGPATPQDAAYFFGISKEDAKKLQTIPLDDLCHLDYDGKTYYYSEPAEIDDIPELTLLSGFDPIIVSYTPDNRFSLPQEYKSKVILKSGICLPTIAVNGQIAGLWNIKKNEPFIEFFAPQPKYMKAATLEMVESIIWQTRGAILPAHDSLAQRKEPTGMIKEIQSRRSVRKYDPSQPVTREQLNQLLEAAMLAPSACNSRPWEFIAITKRETLDEIARIHPHAKMCSTATAAIIVVAIPQTGMPEGYFSQDCAAATQNILLEACSMGLGTCWCGVFPKEEIISSIRELLDIKEPKVPFNIIAVGVPAETPDKRGSFEEERVTYID